MDKWQQYLLSAEAMATSKQLRLKLLVDKENQRVLFAEAGKDSVDVLFNLLAMPVATAAKLLASKGMVGSLGNLCRSVEHMGGTYIPSTFLLQSSATAKRYYRCDCCPNYVTDSSGAPCPYCGRAMMTQLTYVPPKPGAAAAAGDGGGGYVKGVATYMVKDDLSVEPMSTISCITLFNKFHVKEVGSLEERVVEFRVEEGLMLLNASFHSKTVLTDVFLKGSAH
uniref:Formamidopyrimidine-DNA glycosylase n=1 Tax=Anthurium amnicola TaxID=1678845 RepID=A0A1D1Y4Y8_9ARAE